MTLDDLINNAETHAQRLAKRTYSREGIEMFLALEDLSTNQPTETVSQGGELLAQAVQGVAARLFQLNPQRALSLALETVAFHDFGSTSASEPLDPVTTGTGREPLPLTPDSHAETAQLISAFQRGRFICSVNFHNTFTEDTSRLKEQLDALAQRFKSIGLAELEALIKGEPWTDARPPILLIFYEGTRNHIEVAAPLLEALGLTGIFCLIPGFIDAPINEQASFAAAHHIGVNPLEYPDHRLALTWQEVHELAARGHAFVCHTMAHADPEDEKTDVRLESIEAINRMKTMTDQEVTSFVWRRGTPWGVVPRADAYLREVNIRLLISNFKVERLP